MTGYVESTSPEGEEARWRRVDELEMRFTPIASALGIVFVLVVIGEALAEPHSKLQTAFVVVGWVLRGVFVAEFVTRAVLAPSTTTFLKKNWWQVIFLVLPFLRFVAALRLARLARAGRIVGSAIRGGRSAGQALRGRLAWLAVIHTIVVLTSSQLLFEFGAGGRAYGEILHRVALAAVSGEPLGLETGLGAVLDVVLALYAVVVFATLAGALGAYFISQRSPEAPPGQAQDPRSDVTAVR